MSSSGGLVGTYFRRHYSTLPFNRTRELELLNFSGAPEGLRDLNTLLTLRNLLTLSKAPPVPVGQATFKGPCFSNLRIPGFSLYRASNCSTTILSGNAKGVNVRVRFASESISYRQLTGHFFSSTRLVRCSGLDSNRAFFRL